MKDQCKHGWTTPPECPTCIRDERDQLKSSIAQHNENYRKVCADLKAARDERDELKANPFSKETLDSVKQWALKSDEVNDQLRAENEALKEDKARMDWLSDFNGRILSCHQNGANFVEISPTGKDPTSKGTARSAIDAERKHDT